MSTDATTPSPSASPAAEPAKYSWPSAGLARYAQGMARVAARAGLGPLARAYLFLAEHPDAIAAPGEPAPRADSFTLADRVRHGGQR